MNKGLLNLFGPSGASYQYPNDQFLKLVTPFNVSNALFEYLTHLKFIDPDVLIWDTCSGIGVDTLQLARFFPNKILATEICPETHKCLSHNTKQFKRINHQLTSCFNIEQTAKNGVSAQMLIYFDPPWGSSYSSKEEFDFKKCPLDKSKTAIDFIDQWVGEHKMIIKSPIKSSTVEDHLRTHSVKHTILEFPNKRLKFILTTPAS